MHGPLLIKKFDKFLTAQDGTTAIEYSIIAGGIAVAIAGAVGALSTSLAAMWNSVGNLFH
jgi:Flp pilus assembly pilin Flp